MNLCVISIIKLYRILHRNTDHMSQYRPNASTVHCFSNGRGRRLLRCFVGRAIISLLFHCMFFVDLQLRITLEPGHEKMCLMSYANNKGADQPEHPRSLISAFVVHCLDSIISLDSIVEISRL